MLRSLTRSLQRSWIHNNKKEIPKKEKEKKRE
jgi:hypothetical protein